MTFIAGLAGAAMLGILFKPFFGGVDGFFECIRYWLRPDIISLFKGEWSEDRWAEIKLLLWLGLGVGTGVAVFKGLENLFG